MKPEKRLDEARASPRQGTCQPTLTSTPAADVDRPLDAEISAIERGTGDEDELAAMGIDVSRVNVRE
jgi:hypothetical protein